MGAPGNAVDLGGPRERALLARLLVSANHIVAAHQIADDLWSGDPPPRSLATLRVYVSRLRRALGSSASALVTRQPGYGLYIADDDLDARRFGRLAAAGTARLGAGAAEDAAGTLHEALALWRGHALADVADLAFAQAHAARLEEDRLAAIESLKTAELACGRHAAIVGELEQLTDTYPTREQFWSLRMLALYRCGRQADALAAYRTVRTVLADELGVDPSQALRQMHERVLRQDPALDPIPSPTAIDQAAPAPSAPAKEAVGALPSEANSFIGREQELATMSELLVLSRLLTLTGPGGSGKSRLAIRFARNNMSRYPGGVWLVNLAPIIGPEFVVPAIASALSVTEVAGTPLIDGVIAKLASSEALVIADNCEHVIDAVAEVVAMLLSSCPGVRILATSQIRLKVDGEASWPVPPLTMPAVGADDVGEIARSESARLLCDRAALTRPGFRLTGGNASDVANICRRLDGVPLAIELAAARLNALSIATLASKLDDRFLLLTGGSRAALPRHRALVAAIDWSHDLLTEAEQVCLRRLSVFAGGWTLDAAEVVCCDEQLAASLLFDIVGSLVDKSLLIAQERADAMRYGMLESIHVYTGRRLDEAGERETLVRRHFAWLRDLAGHADSGGHSQAAWLDLVNADLDNFMIGLERAVDQDADGHDAVGALALATRLAAFWMVRGPVGVARRWLDAALAAAGPDADPRVRAEALDAAGQLAGLQGDQDAQLRYQHQSLAIWRELGEDAKIASCLGDLGSVAHVRGDHVATEAMYTEALKLAKNSADDGLIARSLSGLGRLTAERGDLAKATEYYEESLARFHAAGDLRRATTILGNLGVVATSIGDADLAHSRLTEHLANARLLGDRKLIGGALTNLGVLMFNAGELANSWAKQQEAFELGELIGDPRLTRVALTNLGIVACARGDYEAARDLHLRGLAMAAQGREPRGIAECLEELAVTESRSGNHERAARLLGAAGQIRDDVGSPIPKVDAHRIEAAAAAIEQTMGHELFETATSAGRAMSSDQVMTYARSADAQTPAAPAP
jgi:predicted ATPase/DNA-binding SARP family transcriptional activator